MDEKQSGHTATPLWWSNSQWQASPYLKRDGYRPVRARGSITTTKCSGWMLLFSFLFDFSLVVISEVRPPTAWGRHSLINPGKYVVKNVLHVGVDYGGVTSSKKKCLAKIFKCCQSKALTSSLLPRQLLTTEPLKLQPVTWGILKLTTWDVFWAIRALTRMLTSPMINYQTCSGSRKKKRTALRGKRIWQAAGFLPLFSPSSPV